MACKILSLDGGGSWALIQARVLERRYGAATSGHEILKKYDLVIANSGGSLVLALLCADKKLSEIINTFNDVNILKAIFKKKFVSHVPYLRDFLPNYDTENKYEVFRTHLQNGAIAYGDKLITELPALIGKDKLQIIITCFDYDRERAVYFRSNKESKMETRWIENAVISGSATDDFKTTTLARAVHASSNAPVQFFDDPASFPITTFDNNNNPKETPHLRLFWDGAVGGNNNPVKAGVLEALANGSNRDEIQIVSIGTASTVCPILYDEQGEPKPEYDFLCRASKIDGWIDDLKRMASSILDDPPDAATFDAHQILGLPYKQNDPKLIRINPLVKPKREIDSWKMPGTLGAWTKEEMQNLFTLDMAVATQQGIELINKLCNDFFLDMFDNQGIRIGGKNMDAILGHKLFSHALTDWNSNVWS